MTRVTKFTAFAALALIFGMGFMAAAEIAEETTVKIPAIKIHAKVGTLRTKKGCLAAPFNCLFNRREFVSPLEFTLEAPLGHVCHLVFRQKSDIPKTVRFDETNQSISPVCDPAKFEQLHEYGIQRGERGVAIVNGKQAARLIPFVGRWPKNKNIVGAIVGTLEMYMLKKRFGSPNLYFSKTNGLPIHMQLSMKQEVVMPEPPVAKNRLPIKTLAKLHCYTRGAPVVMPYVQYIQKTETGWTTKVDLLTNVVDPSTNLKGKDGVTFVLQHNGHLKLEVLRDELKRYPWNHMIVGVLYAPKEFTFSVADCEDGAAANSRPCGSFVAKENQNDVLKFELGTVWRHQ